MVDEPKTTLTHSARSAERFVPTPVAPCTIEELLGAQREETVAVEDGAEVDDDFVIRLPHTWRELEPHVTEALRAAAGMLYGVDEPSLEILVSLTGHTHRGVVRISGANPYDFRGIKPIFVESLGRSTADARVAGIKVVDALRSLPTSSIRFMPVAVPFVCNELRTTRRNALRDTQVQLARQGLKVTSRVYDDVPGPILDLPYLPGQQGVLKMLTDCSPLPEYVKIVELPAVAGKKRKFDESGFTLVDKRRKLSHDIGDYLTLTHASKNKAVAWGREHGEDVNDHARAYDFNYTLNFRDHPDDYLAQDTLVLAPGQAERVLGASRDVYYERIGHVYWGIRFDNSDATAVRPGKLCAIGIRHFGPRSTLWHATFSKIGDIHLIVFYTERDTEWKQEVLDEHFDFLNHHGLLRLRKDMIFYWPLKELHEVTLQEYVGTNQVEVLKRLPRVLHGRLSPYDVELKRRISWPMGAVRSRRYF